MKTVSAWVLAGVLVSSTALPQPAPAQSTQLNPPAARISDRAIQADHQAYEALQGRIKGLNDRGRPVRDYHLAKAQCWLDVSFHEYTRNDRSAFPQAALTESEKLIVGMEQGAAPLPMDTPLVAGAARLRPDLWARAEAQELADRCPAPPAPAAPPPPPPSPPVVVPPPALPEPAPRAATPPPVRERTLELAAQVLFDFDRYREAAIRPFSVVQVENLVRRVQREQLQVVAVRLSGHADRLNGTGRDDYNQRLSERRVQTVREMLVRLGLDARLISTVASGDTQPVEGCEARFKDRTALQECLLPNRRVEIVVELKGR